MKKATFRLDCDKRGRIAQQLLKLWFGAILYHKLKSNESEKKIRKEQELLILLHFFIIQLLHIFIIQTKLNNYINIKSKPILKKKFFALAQGYHGSP